MSGEGGVEVDTKTTDEIPGGASGGTDDNLRDWHLPDVPDDTSAKRRKFRWPGGARPKDPADEEIPLIPKEKGGLPPPKDGDGTTETSFSEGLNYGEAKILLENQKLMCEYPEYGKSGNVLNLVYKIDDYGKGTVYVAGPRGGSYLLYKADGETLNSGLPKAVLKTLGPKRTEIIQQKDEEIEEFEKTIQEDRRVANDENEQLLYVNVLVKEL